MQGFVSAETNNGNIWIRASAIVAVAHGDKGLGARVYVKGDDEPFVCTTGVRDVLARLRDAEEASPPPR